jgi:hypothetical protein
VSLSVLPYLKAERWVKKKYNEAVMAEGNVTRRYTVYGPKHLRRPSGDPTDRRVRLMTASPFRVCDVWRSSCTGERVASITASAMRVASNDQSSDRAAEGPVDLNGRRCL